MTDPCDDRLGSSRPADAAWMQGQRPPVYILKHECPNCGAPVAYPGTSSPVTCRYCGSVTSIYRTGEHPAIARPDQERTAADILGMKLVIRRLERGRHGLARQRDAAVAGYQDCRDRRAPRGPGIGAALLLVVGACLLGTALSTPGAGAPAILGAALAMPFLARLAYLPPATRKHRCELARRLESLHAVKAEVAETDARLVGLRRELAAMTGRPATPYRPATPSQPTPREQRALVDRLREPYTAASRVPTSPSG